MSEQTVGCITNGLLGAEMGMSKPFFEKNDPDLSRSSTYYRWLQKEYIIHNCIEVL